MTEKERKEKKRNPTHKMTPSKTLTLTLSAADLSTETGLDSSDGTTRSARVAGDEVQTVLTLVEFGVGAAAGFASDIFDWMKIRDFYQGQAIEQNTYQCIF